MEAGDEMALYEHLRAQEAEAGPVPKPEEFLSAPTKSQVAEVAEPGPLERPVQESLVAAVVDSEKLAAMRKRIVAESYR